MNWKTFINDKSRQAFSALVETCPEGPDAFRLDSRDYEYADLRDAFLKFDEVARSATGKSSRATYAYDLEFGIQMYEYLTEEGFGLWQAADNGCWAYLSIKVVPEIVYNRWGGYNPDRFYKRNWRIWLKAIWWYVHLAESGESETFDAKSTREVLKGFSQDFMYLLLDHCGGGFRDTLYHELVRRLYKLRSEVKIVGSVEDFFRAVMLQHQIKSTVIDPILVGESAYVDALIKAVLPRFTEDGHGN